MLFLLFHAYAHAGLTLPYHKSKMICLSDRGSVVLRWNTSIEPFIHSIQVNAREEVGGSTYVYNPEERTITHAKAHVFSLTYTQADLEKGDVFTTPGQLEGQDVMFRCKAGSKWHILR